MDRNFEQFFIRLCLAGPLLYIGLQMLFEPFSFAELSRMVHCSIVNFRNALNLTRRHLPPYVPPRVFVSVRARLGIRTAGMTLVLLSMLVLSGIAG